MIAKLITREGFEKEQVVPDPPPPVLRVVRLPKRHLPFMNNVDLTAVVAVETMEFYLYDRGKYFAIYREE